MNNKSTVLGLKYATDVVPTVFVKSTGLSLLRFDVTFKLTPLQALQDEEFGWFRQDRTTTDAKIDDKHWYLSSFRQLNTKTDEAEKTFRK